MGLDSSTMASGRGYVRIPKEHPGFLSQRWGALGMTWGHPWPEEQLRKPACGRCFEAGCLATGSRSPTIRNVPRVPERREDMCL